MKVLSLCLVASFSLVIAARTAIIMSLTVDGQSELLKDMATGDVNQVVVAISVYRLSNSDIRV